MRINACDEQAFEWLYQRHRDWAYAMAWRILGSAQNAEDVLQETFCYVLGKFPGFELRCQFRTFLYPVVRNLALGALRGERRYVGGEQASAAIEMLVSTNEQNVGRDFQDIIASLSPEHRETLMLRYIDGMTLPEIAELVGIPLGTAKSRLHHALSQLRQNPKVRNLLIK